MEKQKTSAEVIAATTLQHLQERIQALNLFDKVSVEYDTVSCHRAIPRQDLIGETLANAIAGVAKRTGSETWAATILIPLCTIKLSDSGIIHVTGAAGPQLDVPLADPSSLDKVVEAAREYGSNTNTPKFTKIIAGVSSIVEKYLLSLEKAAEAAVDTKTGV